MPETGGFTNDLVTKVYEVAGKVEPPEGHLYVRQDFNRVFDVPVAFRNPEQTLGTHVFTSMFDPGDAKGQWMAISVEGGDSASVLDRVEIFTTFVEMISSVYTRIDARRRRRQHGCRSLA